ncbi:hypothetical protein QR680_007473 [Steinernema hermaphroditum]|uniref:Uncharacterized protein n=1 Tax=Steinernema hermaphroditum TaxID=289476 RepID=A0AA39M5F1_9BILA|nr:hypothetical protein QR680_007473 [Steinernema hermaphroditum]
MVKAVLVRLLLVFALLLLVLYQAEAACKFDSECAGGEATEASISAPSVRCCIDYFSRNVTAAASSLQPPLHGVLKKRRLPSKAARGRRPIRRRYLLSHCLKKLCSDESCPANLWWGPPPNFFWHADAAVRAAPPQFAGRKPGAALPIGLAPGQRKEPQRMEEARRRPTHPRTERSVRGCTILRSCVPCICRYEASRPEEKFNKVCFV